MRPFQSITTAGLSQSVILRRCYSGDLCWVRLLKVVNTSLGSASVVATILTLFNARYKAQTPLHGQRLRTCCTTPPTDELTTILHKFATSQFQSPTSRHAQMLGCGKFLSVGGVRSRCPCNIYKFIRHEGRTAQEKKKIDRDRKSTI